MASKKQFCYSNLLFCDYFHFLLDCLNCVTFNFFSINQKQNKKNNVD